MKEREKKERMREKIKKKREPTGFLFFYSERESATRN